MKSKGDIHIQNAFACAVVTYLRCCSVWHLQNCRAIIHRFPNLFVCNTIDIADKSIFLFIMCSLFRKGCCRLV